jgi:hypothetical protein
LVNQATEFTYDSVGNMTMDLDRNIVAIRYNLLNLPDTVQFMNGNQIINRYDAAGRKLRTEYITAPGGIVVPISGTVNSQASGFTRYGTVYNGNKEYGVNNAGALSLLRIHNTEGYVDFDPDPGDATYYFENRYNYYRRDHLGNVREVWRMPYYVHYLIGQGVWGKELLGYNNYPNLTGMVQRTQYYPSGLPWKTNSGDNPSTQPYKHNGCEFIEMHGFDVTDHGNRGLYHAINRYTTMDRFAEKFPWQSPYVHAANNPVRYIDINGDSIWYTQKDNVITMHVTGKVVNTPLRNKTKFCKQRKEDIICKKKELLKVSF